jgi:SulP family sulfate permease
MLFFGSLAKLIPMSALAGVLIVVAYNMSEWRSFRAILKDSPFDVIVLLSTFFLTVLVDLTIAIEVGVVLSALLFMKRMADIGAQTESRIDSDLLEDYTHLPEGIAIYEISGPLFFGSAKQYAQTIKEIGFKSKILIIRMRHVPFVDSTGLHNLQGMIKTLQAYGVEIVLSGVNPAVMKDLKEHHLSTMIGEANIRHSFDDALSHSIQKLNNQHEDSNVFVNRKE